MVDRLHILFSNNNRGDAVQSGPITSFFVHLQRESNDLSCRCLLSLEEGGGGDEGAPSFSGLDDGGGC